MESSSNPISILLEFVVENQYAKRPVNNDYGLLGHSVIIFYANCTAGGMSFNYILYNVY